ncbi:TPA: hypothetical protein N0F65_006862 [Lagenidium giganteum]|uniref:Uncharacterized protein n=1 Tax=Lagenidium giganteum TaxID=4803 RepID=A0AAV2YCC7_9STRA|nr:TPA: hypothetical protein N0F65_006862 [Lagenidium giganteum]
MDEGRGARSPTLLRLGGKVVDDAVAQRNKTDARALSPWARRTRAVTVVLVVVQTLWAVVIPIKNVAVMPYPTLADDGDSTTPGPYMRNTTLNATRTITGREVYRILNDVVNLSLNKSQLRVFFEKKGDFAFDEAGALLTPEEHRVFAEFYAMLSQASEFPAGGFVRREQKMRVVRSDDSQPRDFTLRCSRCDALQGMRCQNASGAICDNDDWDHPETLQLTPIDLNSTTQGMGWQNKVSLVGLVTIVDRMMRTLFLKKDWVTTFQTYDDNVMIWRQAQLVDGGLVLLLDSVDALQFFGYAVTFGNPWDDKDLFGHLDAGVTVIESCFGSEMILSQYYTSVFAEWMIQNALMLNGVYNPVDAVNITTNISHVLDDILSHDLLITSTVGHQQYIDDKKDFVGSTLTRRTMSVTNVKRDRPMSGTMLMGSSPRNLEYLHWYPNSYYSYLKTWVDDNNKTLVVDWRQMGSLYAGFNGFKFDFTHNTMGVYRLSERTALEGSGYAENWFEQEQKIAAWYRNHELTDNNSLIKLGERVWGPDSPSMWPEQTKRYCVKGMFRKITQTVWIMALKKKPVMSHLVYMSMEDPDDPATWFQKQMMVNSVVGEGIGGNRVAFDFSREDGKPKNGESWVLIPLLSAFLNVQSQELLLASIMQELLTTMFSLLEVENGKLMMKDALYCHFGWASLGVNKSDDKVSMWRKLNGTIRQMVNETLHVVEAIHDQMNAAVTPVTIPIEYLSPTADELMVLRKSLVCYNTLETRFLNISMRCWAEQLNEQETRLKTTSEGLRVLKFSMWSLGIVLNIIGAVVSLRFAWRVAILWFHDHFWDLNLTLALNMDIQGIGLISLDAIVIMAFSCFPLILSYHLPIDPSFVPADASAANQNKVFAECMVLLSLTWFLRIGIELGIKVIHLKHYSWWFNLLTSRIRVATMLIILVIRLGMNVDGVSYNQGLTKLIVSCVVTMVLGFLTVIFSLLFDKDNARSTDSLSRQMMQHRLPRNAFGVLGQLKKGWSHTGMQMEGWQVLKIDDNVDALVHGTITLLPTGDCRHDLKVDPLTPQIFKALLKEDKVVSSRVTREPSTAMLPPNRIDPRNE